MLGRKWAVHLVRPFRKGLNNIVTFGYFALYDNLRQNVKHLLRFGLSTLGKESFSWLSLNGLTYSIMPPLWHPIGESIIVMSLRSNPSMTLQNQITNRLSISKHMFSSSILLQNTQSSCFRNALLNESANTYSTHHSCLDIASESWEWWTITCR